MNKIALSLFVPMFFLITACGSPAQSPTGIPDPAEPTVAIAPTVIEIPTEMPHVDVRGAWNASESQRESTNTANLVFDRKKFEFTDKYVLLDDLLVVEYEWIDANRQVWKDTPATAGWGGLNINLLVSVSREGDSLTIAIKDGYIKLQR